MMITGYYGCSCHPFQTWEECKAAHDQKLGVGVPVRNRCTGGEGVVDEATDNRGFCIVKYGPLPRDLHLEHVAGLERT